MKTSRSPLRAALATVGGVLSVAWDRPGRSSRWRAGRLVKPARRALECPTGRHAGRRGV